MKRGSCTCQRKPIGGLSIFTNLPSFRTASMMIRQTLPRRPSIGPSNGLLGYRLQNSMTGSYFD
jgi:hypothetical protein